MDNDFTAEFSTFLEEKLRARVIDQSVVGTLVPGFLGAHVLLRRCPRCPRSWGLTASGPGRSIRATNCAVAGSTLRQELLTAAREMWCPEPEFTSDPANRPYREALE